MQRAVIDTNTWISGLVWGGAPRAIIQLTLDRKLVCVTSPSLSEEFERVLLYPRISRAK